MLRKAVVLAVAGAVLATGCGAGDEGGSAGGGEVTLTYAVWDKNQVPAMEKIAAEFTKANPKIKIKVQLTAPTKEYWTKLQTSVTGGNAPDVFWMNAPRFGLYAGEGVLLPLTDRIAKDGVDLSKFPQSLTDIYKLDGQQYAIPKDFDTIGLWYNKELFDAAKVKYPDETWTWQTMVDAAKKLTNPAKGVYGIAAPPYTQENVYDAIFQAGGEVVSADGKTSGYDNPATQAGVEYWADMIHKHKVSPTAQQMTDTEPTALFSSGKVAMFMGGSWEAVGFQKNTEIKDKVDVAVLPRGQRRAVVIHGLGNVIYAKTKHPDEAWQWVKFLGSEQAQQIQAETGTVISAYEGTAQAWVKSMPNFKLQIFLDELDYSVAYPRTRNTAAWTEDEEKALAEIWAGTKDAKAALNELATAMNADLAQEK
jgi:multiple sugar transport system substrate-binding protein